MLTYNQAFFPTSYSAWDGYTRGVIIIITIIINNLLTVQLPCDRAKRPYFISEKAAATLHASNPGW